MPLTKEKYANKIFTIGDTGPELQRPTYGVQRAGVGYAAIGVCADELSDT